MIRFAAAIGVALCVSQATLHAQAPVFTVQAVSADVYKAPSTGSAVIGHAPRGTALPVTRELGSWVKVSWPRAEDGVGYVHVSMGSLGQSETGRPVAAARSPQPTSEAALPSSAAVRGPAATPQRVPTPVVYLQAPGHLVGFGGRVGGSNVGFGASARAWSRNRFGVQFDLSRVAMAGLAPTERVTSMQFEPGVLYTLADHVADYIWVRPYAGIRNDDQSPVVEQHDSRRGPGRIPEQRWRSGLRRHGADVCRRAAIRRERGRRVPLGHDGIRRHRPRESRPVGRGTLVREVRAVLVPGSGPGSVPGFF